jgi:AcrR family transcriptional regulator
MMAPPTRTPASSWIQAGLRALADGGPGAVRVDRLATSLGVTRGSFYGHFADRQALLEAMLDNWERAATLLDTVEHLVGGGDPRARLRRAGALTFSPGLLPIELAVRDWARRDPAVAERLGRVDNYRMEYLRTLFRVICEDEETVEARCVLAFTFAIGRHFLAAGHGPGALELAVRELLT